MRLRTVLISIVVLAALLAFSSFILYSYFEQTISEDSDLRLYSWADDLLLQIARRPATFQRDPSAFLVHPRANEFIASGVLVQFLDNSGHIVARSAGLKHAALPVFQGEDETIRDVELEDGTKLKLYQRLINVEGERLGQVIVGLPVSTAYRHLSDLRNALIVVMLFTVLALGVGMSAFISLAVLQDQKKFLAFASHELRTPLAVISGSAEVALRGDRPPGEYREVLAEIKDESDWMNNIVSKFLFVFRSGAGAAKIHRQEFNLAELIVEESSKLKRSFPKKVLTLNLPEQAVFSGDRDHIRKLVTNLLDNAAAHTRPDGRIDISLALRNKKFILEVKDDGAGIKKQLQKKIFDAYYRIEQGKKKGLGLGLAICKWVVKAHGGRIRVKSEPGQGATFIVELPL